MVTILRWFTENWQLVIVVGILLLILSMTGTITELYKAAKRGLKEIFTPMGFIIFLALLYVAYRIYLSIMETI